MTMPIGIKEHAYRHHHGHHSRIGNEPGHQGSHQHVHEGEGARAVGHSLDTQKNEGYPLGHTMLLQGIAQHGDSQTRKADQDIDLSSAQLSEFGNLLLDELLSPRNAGNLRREKEAEQEIKGDQQHDKEGYSHLHPPEPADIFSRQAVGQGHAYGVVRSSSDGSHAPRHRSVKCAQSQKRGQTAPFTRRRVNVPDLADIGIKGHANRHHHGHHSRIGNKPGHQGSNQHVHEGEGGGTVGYPFETQKDEGHPLGHTMLLQGVAQHADSKKPKENPLAIKAGGGTDGHDSKNGKDDQRQHGGNGPGYRSCHPPDHRPNEGGQGHLTVIGEPLQGSGIDYSKNKGTAEDLEEGGQITVHGSTDRPL